MSEDKIIVSVLPFENPKNAAEQKLNDEAMKFYLDREMRDKGMGVSLYAANPDHPGHMYRCHAGWTEQGWRTFVTCTGVNEMKEFADGVFLAEDRMKQISMRQRLAEMKAANKN